MKLRTLGRHCREGLRNLGRNGWMTIASVSAVTVTLLLLGVFVVMAWNVEHLSRQVEKQVQISVILKDGTTREQMQNLQQWLATRPDIQSVTFVSKEEGLANLRASLKEDGDLLNGLEKENPLPDKFVVQAKDPQMTGKVAEEISKLPQVESVRYAKEMVERLFQVTRIIRDIGLVFIVGLLFTAMFLIANTIKLTIFARRREIEIMKLVGATNGFIRWPFFIEGVLMGAIGAVIPIVLIVLGYHYLLRMVEGFYYFQLVPAHPLVEQVTVLLLCVGAFIGMWGSLVSMRRFLKV
ncbi:MAG: ABC transporter permease [Alicyclobacillaceae bacterium]|nr:ABC transporter permease [Alicyclobacillaceae bacterium]